MLNDSIVIYNGKIGKYFEFNGHRRFVAAGADSTLSLFELSDTDEVYPTNIGEQQLFLISSFKYGKVIRFHTLGNFQFIEAIVNQEIRFYIFKNYSFTYFYAKSLAVASLSLLCMQSNNIDEDMESVKYICRMLRYSDDYSFIGKEERTEFDVL